VPAGFEAMAPPAAAKAAAHAARAAVARIQDGDDFAHARPIAALPFEDLANTCGFANDVEAPCTFLGAAPDIVYRLTPSAPVIVDIDVCDTSYDAAVHVYREGMELVACNDDACGRGPRIAGLELEAATTYYIVIDGWYGACGGYRLWVTTDPAPCVVEVPAGAVPEGEPACADDVYDRFNGGCNDFPYAFRRLECSDAEIVVTGSYGTYPYYSDEFRDTDWYEVRIAYPGTLAAEVEGAAATQLAIVDGRLGCGEYGIACGSVVGPACATIECEAAVEPGTYWIFVATRWFTGVRCPTGYRLSIRGAGCGTVPVAARSWGDVKRFYR